jgi:drug/metabolite transporter (DMT)-like permease
MHPGVVYALLAALLFGASTPWAKLLVGQVEPLLLAGLLYLGSGLGLLACLLLRRLAAARPPAALGRAEWPWLAGAVLAGGVAGPTLLMLGLRLSSASSAALLLNMEGVLTAGLAWWVFKENVDRRVAAGMGLIVLAGVLLAWGDGAPGGGTPWGALAVLAACLCWAVDNNLTRKLSAGDAMQIACVKGLVAGAVNLALALALGQRLPGAATVLGAATVGFLGYGLSLVLFVLALRHLGTARTGAYFSAAPFAGALLALPMLGEAPGATFWLAALLMAAGIALHLAESHGHEHRHEALAHAHGHRHDQHHQHEHAFDWDGREPHSHPHQHLPLTHSHAHFPDIHHRHRH